MTSRQQKTTILVVEDEAKAREIATPMLAEVYDRVGFLPPAR